MKHAPGNPAENTLRPGITDEDLNEAVACSGYPLQSVVATKLRKHFAVQEEWSFVDAEEKIVRSMDLVAEKILWDTNVERRVRPSLNLIVECKRSELPYVFFLTDQKIRTPRFPLIAGLAEEEIKISTDDDPSTWTYDVLGLLGAQQHPFLDSDVSFCTTFTRCERQGSKVRLSGADPYNSLVHPLVKATEHFRAIEAPPSTAVYYDLHFAIALAVLESPMVGVPVDPRGDPIMIPWVRVPRHRGLENARSHDHRRNVYAIDVVHVSFLEAYVEQHLLPFASFLAGLAIKHHVEIAEGTGFVSGMGKNWFAEVESRVVPRKIRDVAKRTSAALKTIAARARRRPKHGGNL